MQRKHLLAIVACAIVALIAATWFLAHSPAERPQVPHASALTQPAPARATGSGPDEDAADPRATPPSAPTQPPEHAPVAAAPGEPSDGSFRNLRQCVYASRELITAKQIADCSGYEGKPQFSEALAECLNGRMNARNRIEAAEAVLSHCDQTDLGRRYFEATKQAAKRGNADAQLCYLEGDFFSPEGTLIFTDEEIEQYKKDALAYVDAALKRGDWRIVHLLNTRQFHPGSGPLRVLENIGQPQTRYKMTKLLRLGASGEYAKALDSDLRGMTHPDLNPAAALPPEIVRAGDAWAEETYTKHFAGVPGLTEASVVCRPERGQPGSLPDLTHPD